MHHSITLLIVLNEVWNGAYSGDNQSLELVAVSKECVAVSIGNCPSTYPMSSNISRWRSKVKWPDSPQHRKMQNCSCNTFFGCLDMGTPISAVRGSDHPDCFWKDFMLHALNHRTHWSFPSKEERTLKMAKWSDILTKMEIRAELCRSLSVSGKESGIVCQEMICYHDSWDRSYQKKKPHCIHFHCAMWPIQPS